MTLPDSCKSHVGVEATQWLASKLINRVALAIGTRVPLPWDTTVEIRTWITAYQRGMTVADGRVRNGNCYRRDSSLGF